MNPSAESIDTTLGLNAPKKSSLKKYLIIAAVLILITAGGAWAWLNHKENTAIRYQTIAAKIKTLTSTVSATGNLEPTNSVDVGIEVSGTIIDLPVDYNDYVRAGQVMARLDTTKLLSNVTSAKASLARYQASILETEATLKNATNEWNRVQKMFAATGGNYPSKQELDDTQTAVEKAKAGLASAKAQRDQAYAELSVAQDNLRKAVVVSPMDGIVLQRKVEKGQTVIASMTTPVLFVMAQDLTKMKAVVSIDEADIAEVHEGQKTDFSVDAYPDRTFSGTLTQLRLNSETTNGVVTYDAIIEIANPKLLLRPGMTVSAHIVTEILENVLTVPNAALRFTPPKDGKPDDDKEKNSSAKESSKSVWVLRDNTATKIPVIVGKSDGTDTQISSNQLKSNDLVIIGTEETK